MGSNYFWVDELQVLFYSLVLMPSRSNDVHYPLPLSTAWCLMVTGPAPADRALHVLRPPEPGPPPRPQDPEHLPDAVPGPRQDRGLRHLQDPVHQEQGLHRGGHPLLHITGAV